MGTRAVYSFFDDRNDVFHVYKHWDNYPTGAAESLTKAVAAAWDQPRYEHDEFGAAFIAANKKEQGGVRLTHRPENHCDIEYIYEVSQARNGQMILRAFEANYWDDTKPVKKEFFYGRLKDFVIEYGEDDVKRMWDEYVSSEHKAFDVDAVERREYERLKKKFEGVKA